MRRIHAHVTALLHPMTPSPVETNDQVVQMMIEELAADWHLHFVKGILQHVVSIQVKNPAT